MIVLHYTDEELRFKLELIIFLFLLNFFREQEIQTLLVEERE